MLNNCYFPENWKIAKIFPLLKRGKAANDVSSYRPISLLPNISKIFESIVNRFLTEFSNTHNIIPNNQFGFRRYHSTYHAMSKLSSDICWAFNGRNALGALLIDFKSAFDSVWLLGLFYKLHRLNFPTFIIKLLWNMLRNKKFYIEYNVDDVQYKSNTFVIKNGLQQGTINAPILFSIYIADLLRNSNNNLAFADDIITYYYSNNIENINKILNYKFKKIIKYSEIWALTINFQKCESILFRLPVNKCNENIKRNWKKFKIDYNNIIIESKSNVKYLGLNFDKFFYFHEHVKNQIVKCENRFKMLCRLFYSKHLHSDVKVLAYQTLLKPLLTYACPIWFNINHSYAEKLRLTERRILRACLKMFKEPRIDGTIKYIKLLII